MRMKSQKCNNNLEDRQPLPIFGSECTSITGKHEQYPEKYCKYVFGCHENTIEIEQKVSNLKYKQQTSLGAYPYM